MLNMPWPLRYGLVYGLIVPTRTRTSSEAYKKVWSERGAPLVRFSEDLRAAVQARLPQDIVRIGMRYGQSYRVKTALLEAKNIGVREVIALPLFPQFSEAATASAMAELYDVMAAIKFKVPVKTKQDFYDHPGFIAAQAKLVEAKRTALQPDHILMSYHGLPENHVQATDQSGLHCLKSAQCCERIVAANGRC